MSVILLVEIEGRTHSLTLSARPLILGRSKKCNVRFADQLMSSKHCEISLNDHGRVVVKDLNSTNGTFINEVKVEAGHVFIGDILRVGNIQLVIDNDQLTPSERNALTDENVKTRQKFVDLKVKKQEKTKVVADFTQINMARPDDLNDNKTQLLSKEARAKNHPEQKEKSKRKAKIVNKDQTGIFKKLFQGFRKED